MLPELHTERLLMREVREDDAHALQAIQNRPEQLRHQAVEPEELADGARRLQRYFQHRGADDNQRLFGYVAHRKSDGTLIGQVSLSCFFHPEIASIGFGVATEYWGHGYAAEMAANLIGFGFDRIGLHRIAADVAIENAACRRVLEKIGMSYEGTSRDCIWAQGRWWTEAKYAVLAGDRKMPVNQPWASEPAE
jgi:ribosomal-protein-alanine N-acetyltransferase